MDSPSSCRAGRTVVAALTTTALVLVLVLALAPAAAHAATLSWAPPTMTSPITVQLTTGADSLKLDDTRDYIVRYPASKKTGYTKLVGGRNIVIIGGYGTIPSYTSTSDRRNLYIQDGPAAASRTVHIEGILFDASGGGEGDGIAISAPKALVQIQNARIVGLRGQLDRPSGATHEHADIVQPWGGVRELRIDRLTGSSTYQGLQINRDLGTVGSATLRNVNLTALPNIAGGSGGGYMLWLNCPSYPISFTNVTITPRGGRALTKSVWPDSGSSTCPAATATVEGVPGTRWPSGQPSVTGGIRLGSAATTDIVPPGTVGIGYRTPGYGSSPATPTAIDPAYTGWGIARTATGAPVTAWQWNATTRTWAYGTFASGSQVYVYPFGSGWSWAWTQATGWRAVRGVDLVAPA